MTKEAKMETCIKCKKSFKKDELKKLEVGNVPIDLFICKACFAEAKKSVKHSGSK